MNDDIQQDLENYRTEFRKANGIKPAKDADERLTVLIFNHGYAESGWHPISLHETRSEADWIATQLQTDGHGAEVRTLPLFREGQPEHNGTTNIGKSSADADQDGDSE